MPPQAVQLLLLLWQLVVLRMGRLLFFYLLLRLATGIDYRIVFDVRICISFVVVIIFFVRFFILVIFLIVFAVVATVGPRRTSARRVRQSMLSRPLLAMPAPLGRRVRRYSPSFTDRMLLLLVLLRVGQQIG